MFTPWSVRPVICSAVSYGLSADCSYIGYIYIGYEPIFPPSTLSSLKYIRPVICPLCDLSALQSVRPQVTAYRPIVDISAISTNAYFRLQSFCPKISLPCNLFTLRSIRPVNCSAIHNYRFSADGSFIGYIYKPIFRPSNMSDLKSVRPVICQPCNLSSR